MFNLWIVCVWPGLVSFVRKQLFAFWNFIFEHRYHWRCVGWSFLCNLFKENVISFHPFGTFRFFRVHNLPRLPCQTPKANLGLFTCTCGKCPFSSSFSFILVFRPFLIWILVWTEFIYLFFIENQVLTTNNRRLCFSGSALLVRRMTFSSSSSFPTKKLIHQKRHCVIRPTSSNETQQSLPLPWLKNAVLTKAKPLPVRLLKLDFLEGVNKKFRCPFKSFNYHLDFVKMVNND